MRRFLKTTLHPEWYHGHHRKPPLFEGWYYKLIDRSERHRYAVIPGIFLGTDPRTSHAFVQVLDGVTGGTTYHRYPVEEFWAAEGDFDVRVGPNRFTLEQISLRIEAPERTVTGDVRFTGLTPWPVTLSSPGIMGWYAWVPFMECYHGVLSIDHEIDGALTVDGQRVDFTGGRGYIEKDWGRSFPAAWVWLQTNHFEQPGTSLTGSVAMIPWVGRAFRGFIIGLWHSGELYRFATYTGARIEKLAISDTEVTWVVRDRRNRLEMVAHRKQSGLLRGPSGVDMGVRVPETLQATVAVRLANLAGGEAHALFEGTGRNAGLEVAGDLPRLLKHRRKGGQ
jgi:tocopherol cyclase